jgi:hypothetical protein
MYYLPQSKRAQTAGKMALQPEPYGNQFTPIPYTPEAYIGMVLPSADRAGDLRSKSAFEHQAYACA